jgi:prophage tail gpP-like protein
MTDNFQNKNKEILEVAQKIALAHGIGTDAAMHAIQNVQNLGSLNLNDIESVSTALNDLAIQERKKLPWWKQAWLSLTDRIHSANK